MQHRARPAVMRQVEYLHGDLLGAELFAQLPPPLRVGPVGRPERDRPLVEPQLVAAVGTGLARQPAGHGHADAREITLGRARLTGSNRLGLLKHDRALGCHDERIVHVGGIHEALESLGNLHPAAEVGEQRAERLMLSVEQVWIRPSPLRGLPVAGERRTPDQNAFETRGHRAHSVVGGAHGPGRARLHRIHEAATL